MKIQPISSWQNGQELQGTEFSLIVVNDNLSTSAMFFYTISTEQISHMETVVVTPVIPAWDEIVTPEVAAYDEVVDGVVVHHDAVPAVIVHHDEIPAVTTDILVIDSPSIILINANITMDGQDYQTWDSSVSANEWAYNWAINKLNLVLVSNQIFA